MKKILTILIISLMFVSAKAQTDEEYRMEIGVGVGLVAYEGDFNGSVLSNMQFGGSVVLRRVFNPYMGLKMSAMYGKLTGSSKDVKTHYPDFVNNPYSFSNTLIDTSVTYEYNFWPYGTGRDYRGAQPITPFVFAGLGATYVSLDGQTDKNSVFSANVPLGIGIKYKAGKRVNIGVEWAMHFSLSDELDGKKDPYDIPSTGAFKNTDCYSTLQFTITYSFKAKCRTCHNEDE